MPTNPNVAVPVRWDMLEVKLKCNAGITSLSWEGVRPCEGMRFNIVISNDDDKKAPPQAKVRCTDCMTLHKVEDVLAAIERISSL